MGNGTREHLAPDSTGLIVFDLLESAREKIESRGALAPARRLVNECRALGVPVFFTRPMHRPDGLDRARTVPDIGRDHLPHVATPPRPGGGANSPGSLPLREFGVGPHDYDVMKHRWSAFYGTALELSLRTRGITTVIVIGGTAHIGVASTVYSARDRDLQVYVAKDACHGEQPEFDCLMDFIFPQVCHVRSSEEILKALR